MSVRHILPTVYAVRYGVEWARSVRHILSAAGGRQDMPYGPCHLYTYCLTDRATYTLTALPCFSPTATPWDGGKSFSDLPPSSGRAVRLTLRPPFQGRLYPYP